MTQAYTEARRTCFVVVDFETTGTVPGYPVEPWQVGVVRLRGAMSQPEARFDALLRVGDRPFNPQAPGRHAALRDRLAIAPTFVEIWPKLSDWLTGFPLVAHHAATERGLLTRLAPLHRLGPWIDTLALAREAYPRLASKALSDVMAALGLEERVRACCPGREPHDALYDATACALLLAHFLSLPGWERVTVEALADRARPRRTGRKLG